MGWLSFWHFVVLAAVLAVVIAHHKIPVAMGSLGATLRRFRRGRRNPLPDNVIEGTFERRDE
jgi:Sec-independent protein translocase protein TatA